MVHIKRKKISLKKEQTESQMKKNESNIRGIWDNVKRANLCIIGISEGEEREKRIENVFEEITAENFPNLKKETDIQIQEAQRVPNMMNPNRPTPTDLQQTYYNKNGKS